MVELLVSRGADSTITRSTYRWTPLMIAACRGHVAVVRYLLRIRAVRATGIIDARSTGSERGCTALRWAAHRDHEEVVKLLVEVGASPMVATNHDKTPTTSAS